MKIKFPLTLYCMLVLCLFGCSIDIAQPIPVSEVGTAAPTNAAPSVMTTTVPITWANLNLTGRLLYTSSVLNGNVSSMSIQTLDLATGEVNKIFTTTGDAWVFYMTVSPDSKQLVMSYIPPSDGSSSPSRALYIMPLEGTIPPQPLFSLPVSGDHYLHAEWSPDGQYIYYVHYTNTDQPYPVYEIFRMRYAGGQPEKIADNAFWPRISSDSTKLVYVSIDPVSGSNELFLANADGSNPQKVILSGTWMPGVMDAPIFSPDGASILFSAPPPPQAYQPNWFEKIMGIQIAKAHAVPSDWWSVPVTGGALTRLTQIQTINLFGSISPDQKYIASVSGEGLFVMDLNGSNLTRLLFDPGVSGTVSWMP